jgi:hypothetical protein
LGAARQRNNRELRAMEAGSQRRLPTVTIAVSVQHFGFFLSFSPSTAFISFCSWSAKLGGSHQELEKERCTLWTRKWRKGKETKRDRDHVREENKK